MATAQIRSAVLSTCQKPRAPTGLEDLEEARAAQLEERLVELQLLDVPRVLGTAKARSRAGAQDELGNEGGP